MSGEILFLAHRIPFPPDRGDKIRSHHVLKALAQIAPVHVGCLAEDEQELLEEPQLRALAKTHWAPSRGKPLAVAGIEALLTGKPISLAAFGDASLAGWVRATLAEHPIAAIYVFSGQMGQYVPADWGGRLVVDLVDVDSAKFDAYADLGKGPLSWVYRREGRLLRGVEADLARRANHCLLVSAAEADLLRARTGDGAGTANISALRNGIDFTAYDPKLVHPHSELDGQAGPHFVFTGQMDYAPNIAAVERFARSILPAIREIHAAAQFHIVGRAPSAAVEKLAEVPGTRVWGAVPDTRPFIAAADMVVAPLTIARGVQNKVLEAMAMGKAALVSPEAAVGIDAVHGEHLLVCEDDKSFVAQALGLIDAPDRSLRIGQAAREFVCSTMGWPAMLAQLPQLLGFDLPHKETRDAA